MSRWAIDGSEPPRWDVAILYAAAVAGYPLIAGLPILLGADNRAISVPFRAVVLGLSAWTVVRSAWKGDIYRGPLWLPLFAFWLMYMARMLWDTLIDPVALGQPPIEYFLYGLGTCFAPMLAMFSLPAASTLRLALRLTILSSTIAAMSALVLGARALLGGDLSVVASGRFELWTLNPIGLGHLGASLATLAMFRLQMERFRRWPATAGLLFAVLLGLFCTCISASKGPLIALAANGALLLVIEWRSGKPMRALAGLVVAPALGIQAALYLQQRFGFAIVSRFQSALEDAGVESVTERIEMMSGAWHQFLAHPLTGSSLDERVWLTYPHNLFLESFMAVGLLGGFAYVVFHLGALQSAVRLVRSTQPAAWVAILCLQYSIGALFSGSLYFSNTMWAFLAAAVAAEARWAAKSPSSFASLPESMGLGDLGPVSGAGVLTTGRAPR